MNTTLGNLDQEWIMVIGIEETEIPEELVDIIKTLYISGFKNREKEMLKNRFSSKWLKENEIKADSEPPVDGNTVGDVSPIYTVFVNLENCANLTVKANIYHDEINVYVNYTNNLYQTAEDFKQALDSHQKFVDFCDDLGHVETVEDVEDLLCDVARTKHIFGLLF